MISISASQPPEFVYQPLCFNQTRFRNDLGKKPKITLFKDAISGVSAHFDQRFLEGDDIRSLITERASFIDLILHYAWYQYQWDNDIALIAVGGYGRGELHPHSDIDILLLLDDKSEHKYDEQIQKLITFLWDIGLEIGSSVRTLSHCTQIAKDDITVATNLIEARRITGNDYLRDQLQILTSRDKMWPVDEFFKAKSQEQTERHEKHNNTECNLEPNVKNAPGGLRDIQMINWVAKRFYGVLTLRQLEGHGFFTEKEFATLRSGEAFLWRVRYGLHHITGRADERLLFEYQREIAVLFGYKDTDKRLAVEQFMHQYYRTVIALRELNDVLLQFLDEAIRGETKHAEIKPINERFQLHNDYIEVTRRNVFDKTPSALLEIFVLMGNSPNILGVRASTIRLIRERRHLIDKKFRDTPENKIMFLALFSIDYGLVTQITRMKRYGILGRYLPAFGQIMGQMQHDLFHRYTVDAHTLLVIKNLRRFTLPSKEKMFPIAAHIMKNLSKPELLYIAGLFHDIGKGRGGDHSTLGAADAIDFCENHGLSGADTRLVAWLVEKHLLMSYVSQKQDISDPDVIHNFACEVRDQRRLDYLYALTVADMNGTNPEIWNSWRASLMRQLYLETKRALRRGLENTVDQHEIIEETKLQAALKLEDKDITQTQAHKVWNKMGDEYFIRESHLDIAWQTEALLNHTDDSPLILIRETTSKVFAGATQIFIHMKDAQHVFSAAATCIAQLGFNIQDAKIYNSADGYTLDTFYILDENFKPFNENEEKYKKIHEELTKELNYNGEYSEISLRRTPRQLKQFPIRTRTSISNDITAHHTVLEVISPDRPGLLATIAHIFMDYGIYLRNAKISTLGERVEDVFFITDTHGEPLSNADLCEQLQHEICLQLDQQVKKELT